MLPCVAFIRSYLMPRYRTRKAMTLSGTQYARGAIVPEDLVASVPAGRLRSLINTGLFTEVEDGYVEPTPEEPATTPETETCPVCGDEFKRLAQHISMKHETPEALEEAHLDDSV